MEGHARLAEARACTIARHRTERRLDGETLRPESLTPSRSQARPAGAAELSCQSVLGGQCCSSRSSAAQTARMASVVQTARRPASARPQKRPISRGSRVSVMHAPDTRLRAAPLAWAMLLHRQRCEQGLCPGWTAPSPTGIAHRSCCIFENFNQMRQTRLNTSRADSTTHRLLASARYLGI